MNNDEINLMNKFKQITTYGWIKGVNNLPNSVGLTFENVINKPVDSLFFPDYSGIEIKCTQRFSRYAIALFSIAFDGPFLYEMDYLLSKYGKDDEVFSDKKVLMSYLKINKYVLINEKYYFKMVIDYDNKRICINIFDIDYNLIEEGPYIEFDSIKNHLEVKLSKCAVIYASKKNIDNDKFFRYYKIILYHLKSFDVFIDLLEKNILIVNLIGRISRSGESIGKQKNKNVIFLLSKYKFDLLFDRITYYDSDEVNTFV